MAQKLNNGRYRVQVRGGGFPVFDQVFTRRADALAAEQAERARRTKPTLYDADMTLAAAAARYFESALFVEKKPHTQAGETSKIKPVLAALGNFALRHLADGQRIADYRDSRLKVVSDKTKRKIGFNTVRLELAALAAVFDWVIERHILPRKPTIGIRRPHGKPRERRLNDTEAFRLNMFLSSNVSMPENLEPARFVVIQRELGCRPGELATLRRVDWDPRGATVTFRDTKSHRASRTALVSAVANRLLGEQLVFAKTAAPESPYVFTTWKRDRAPRAYHYKTAIQFLRDLGMVDPDFHAHAARREHISSSLEHGVPHNDIMKQVGQRSIAALLMYDQAQANHPAVRARLKTAAEDRSKEEVGKLARALHAPAAAVAARLQQPAPTIATRPPRRRRPSRWKQGDPVFTLVDSTPQKVGRK